MAKLLAENELTQRVTQLVNWQRQGQEIVRHCKFPDFKAAMAFVNSVAEEAEKIDHHPDILIQYNKVRLTLSTHSAGGLTDLDLTLAQTINTLNS